MIRLSEDSTATIVRKYYKACRDAATIYNHIAESRGDDVVVEVSMDETDEPQTPPELLVILALLADEKIPVQTIAPKFTGRFNKGVDYVGDLAQFEQEFSDVSININEGILTLVRPSEAKDHKSKHGLYRALINNMIIGVSEGWTKELELVGVGYRATAQGQKLELALGFSHSIVMSLANEIKVETVSEKGANPIIKLSSFDKQLVGQVAAKIRSFRKPEPYKGKGIRFVGEQIRRKAGKQA